MAKVKVPPHNEEAEQSVLGAILIDKDAINVVSEILKPTDFYNSTHEIIYDAMLVLYELRKPIDVITLTAELKKKKKFSIVGQAYLADLVNSVPTAANVLHYAYLIKETATKRSLIQMSTFISQMSFEEEHELKDILNHAESSIFSISQGNMTRGFIPIKQSLAASFDRIDALHKTGAGLRGIRCGFLDLDTMLSGMQPSNLIILAARPGQGKTAMAVNIAQFIAVNDKVPIGIFSLEMSQEELVDRLLVGQADVDAWRLKTGKLSEADFTKLSDAMGQLADAPIFIDDTPGISISAMRTKARRLQLEQNIGLLVVDYLQLVDPGRKYDNRVQEVSIVSQALKNLARELKIPVLALSQLSRAVEHRGEKKPQLADLRESGCLTGDSLLLRADTGELVPIRELTKISLPIPVVSLDETWKLKIFPLIKAFSSGIKKVYRLHLRSGKEIRASANHQFKTLYEWKRLDSLQIGEKIAVPRFIPKMTSQEIDVSDEKIVLLAHMIGDGCYIIHQPMHYTSGSTENLHAVFHAAKVAFNMSPRIVKQENWYYLYLSNKGNNPIIHWFQKLGIHNQHSYHKEVPSFIFQLPKQKIAIFLSHLWSTDGNISKYSSKWSIYYATTSKKLAHQVSHLLLRFDILSRIRKTKKTGYRGGYIVDINGRAEQVQFLTEIGVFNKMGKVRQAIADLDEIHGNPNVDVIPKEIWGEIEKIRKANNLSTREFHKQMDWAFSGTQRHKNGISRSRLEKISKILLNDNLKNLAHSDIFWDEVIGITEEGEEEVYDATVLGAHNFLANDIIVHNSIEQDADVVMFLYRVDDEISPQIQTKLLVAKHRNGPTGEIDLLFRGDRIRFYSIEKKRDSI